MLINEPFFKETLDAFNTYQVEYILIGGYAVNHYGYSRYTGGLDIWVKPTVENKNKLYQSLIALGYKEIDLVKMQQTENLTEAMRFQLGADQISIDVVTLVDNLTFDQAQQNINWLKMNSINIPMIDYNDLIKTKIASTRTKDKLDVEELQKINGMPSSKNLFSKIKKRPGF